MTGLTWRRRATLAATATVAALALAACGGTAPACYAHHLRGQRPTRRRGVNNSHPAVNDSVPGRSTAAAEAAATRRPTQARPATTRSLS